MEEQRNKAAQFRPGCLVKVISSITAKDLDGNKVILPVGTQGTVIEVADLIGHLEIEFVLPNDIAVAIVRNDQVKPLWYERT